jgi:hypothetical protein
LLFVFVEYAAWNETGWRALQSQFLVKSVPSTVQLRRVSGCSQAGTSRMAIKCGFDNAGLYLHHSFPFILFHKQLLIPWGEMSEEVVDNGFYSFSANGVNYCLISSILAKQLASFRSVHPKNNSINTSGDGPPER